jgi:gas vesicle protein
MEATIKTGQERMRAEIKVGQENMESAINSIWSKLQETIKNQVEEILSSVDQWTHSLHKELNVKIKEMQPDLQTVMTSIHFVACTPVK